MPSRTKHGALGSTGLGIRPSALAVTVTCLLLAPLACEDQGIQLDEPDAPVVLAPEELCSDHGDDAIATFEDPNLEFQVRWALSVPDGEDLTCGRISELQFFVAVRAGIENLAGIQNLSGLRGLNLGYKPLNEIDPLGRLPNLDRLVLQRNSLTDIGALRRLPHLTSLALYDNAGLTDIAPLLLNPGLGTDDWVDLRGTAVSCSDVDALWGKGALVASDCQDPAADVGAGAARYRPRVQKAL